jgi:soluble lytic murein transglycosylase-like protein
MKYTLLIFPIFMFFCTSSMRYDKQELIIEDPIIEDPLIAAIIQVESGGDTLAYNSKEDAVGCLQIRPIMVREVNRLLGKDSFTLSDRWSKVKSIQMFNILRSHLKGASDEEIARTWNGGYNGKNIPETLQYWKKVKQYTQKNIK